MDGDDVREFFRDVGSVLVWTAAAVAITLAVFELLDRRYHIMKEVFDENSVAAGVLAGSFVLGIFYVVAQLLVS